MDVRTAPPRERVACPSRQLTVLIDCFFEAFIGQHSGDSFEGMVPPQAAVRGTAPQMSVEGVVIAYPLAFDFEPEVDAPSVTR